MTSTRTLRAKRAKLSDDSFVADFEQESVSSTNDHEYLEEARKSKIRDSNREFARRMSILQTWSDYWTDYQTREGEAYPQQEARDIVKRHKKISCPIETCKKVFTSVGGLKYHYARCNIQKSFKCKVCQPYTSVDTRGDLLRHMILHHLDQLPSLNEEQTTIANGYLTREPRSESSKKDRRLNSDLEAQQSPANLVEAFKNLQQRVFSQDLFSLRPYKDWQTLASDWEPITHIVDRRPYYPPEQESMRLKIPNGSSDYFVCLKAGQSIVFKRDKQGSPLSFVFYTGGINTASTWLPKSVCDPNKHLSPDIMTVAVNCCSMNQSCSYKDNPNTEACLQFWTFGDDLGFWGGVGSGNMKLERKLDRISLIFMVGHNFGTIYEMSWCPLGTSWQPQVNTEDSWSRIGLLALACGDGLIRILSVPHPHTLLSSASASSKNNDSNIIENTPIFKVQPVAFLMPPGVGPSTNYQPIVCKSLNWSLENNQRFLIAGYSNGSVAMFDLANVSPIIYSQYDHRHTYRPLRSWFAHGGPVTGIALSSDSTGGTIVASGSSDRQLKISNPMDLNSFLSFDRAPITRMFWDFRFRGIVTATDSAFTSFSNRISYKYPHATEGAHTVTLSTHRATVFGLAHSLITGAIASGDQAGELFVMPHFIVRPLHKRDRTSLSAHNLYSMIPCQLDQVNSSGKRHQLHATTNGTMSSSFTNKSLINTTTTTAAAAMATTQGDILVDADGDSMALALLPAMSVPNVDSKTVLVSADCASENGEDGLEADADFSRVERDVANKPNKFIIPIEHRPITTYSELKKYFGLEFEHHNWQTTNPRAKLPDSCLRALDLKAIYCDRPCDYPISSINSLTWSPNLDTFSYLLCATQNGFCRLDLIEIVDQLYRCHVNSPATPTSGPRNIISSNKKQSRSK